MPTRIVHYGNHTPQHSTARHGTALHGTTLHGKAQTPAGGSPYLVLQAEVVDALDERCVEDAHPHAKQHKAGKHPLPLQHRQAQGTRAGNTHMGVG